MAFPTITATGLTFVEVATTTVTGATDTQTFRLPNGAITIPKTSGAVSFYSTNGTDWSTEGIEGPAHGAHKCAVNIGYNETLSIHRTSVETEDGFELVTKRSTNNWSSVTNGTATLDTPNAVPLSGDAGDTEDGMLAHHGALQLSNGDILLSLYGNHLGDSELATGYPPVFNFRKYRTTVVRSADRGASFGDETTVAYNRMKARGTDPNFSVKTYSSCPLLSQEGLNESDLVEAPNGDLLCFMRSGGRLSFPDVPVLATPLYMSRATDGYGYSWSLPVAVADRSSNPNAVTLASGVIVLVYSRPGVWVCFSDDHGETWKGHTQISTSDDYADVVKFDEKTCLLTYWDAGVVKATKLQVTKTGGPVYPDIEFYCTDHRISSGQTTTLSWRVQNGANGRIRGGAWGSGAAASTPQSGLVTDPITETTEYVLKFESASHPGSYAERRILVTVT